MSAETETIATRRVLLVQPGYGGIEPESYHAAQASVEKGSDLRVGVMRPVASLLAHAFNLGAAFCLEHKYDYFAMLHGDIGVEAGFMDKLVAILDEGRFDVIHACSPIKDHRRLTSTAWAYWDDQFAPVRRLAIKELHRLPETFGIEEIREQFDPKALRLLPNTGCLCFRADTWFKKYTGFTINDQLATVDGEKWSVDVMPEDWNFGHWCGRNGVRVGGTRVIQPKHFGRWCFTCDPGDSGWETDQTYLVATGQKESEDAS